MKLNIAVTALLLGASSAIAQQGWVELFSSAEGTISYQDVETIEGFRRALFRAIDSDGESEFAFLSVPVAECSVGNGHIIEQTLDGNFVSSEPFAMGDQVLGIIAQALCS